MEIVGVSEQTSSFIFFYRAGISLQTPKSASVLSYFRNSVHHMTLNKCLHRVAFNIPTPMPSVTLQLQLVL